MVHVDGSEEAAEERPSVRLITPRQDTRTTSQSATVTPWLQWTWSLCSHCRTYRHVMDPGDVSPCGCKSPPGEDISRFNMKLAQFKLQSEVSPIVQVSWATKTRLDRPAVKRWFNKRSNLTVLRVTAKLTCMELAERKHPLSFSNCRAQIR